VSGTQALVSGFSRFGKTGVHLQDDCRQRTVIQQASSLLQPAHRSDAVSVGTHIQHRGSYGAQIDVP